MAKNILPPGAETYLSSKTGPQISSALSGVYQNIMVETAVKEFLTRLGIDLGVPKPAVLFSEDNLWRAIVRALAFEKRHTRLGVAKVMELILGPQISQVTTLDRTIYKNITVGSQLTIDPPSPNSGGSPYTVSEVLTHHLIFPSGTFGTIPESNVSYSINGTVSTTGSLITLADGKQALVDYTVAFVNTHPEDYLTQLNKNIPQYGEVIFNKNSNLSSIPASSFSYTFYDRNRTGILKLDANNSLPGFTYNRWMPIRSSELSGPVSSGSLTLSLLSSANFPTSAAPVQTVQAGVDSVKILTPGVAGGPFLITAVSKHEITLGAPSFTLPGAPTTTEILYEIETVAGSGFLSGGRGHLLSSKGKILSTTRLFDPTVDFTELLRPQVSGTTEPFLITINRAENNEETIEVVYRAGNTLHLVPDPNDPTGATSLLKYVHDAGEPVEVYNKDSSTATTYFPLSAAGATVSTATAGSSAAVLRDSTNPFQALNANATYGDELELVTVPAGSANSVGELRTINGFVAADHVTVNPPFADTLLGCTYRIRKLYKAGLDNFLYVSDSSVFPEENFSIILNRGKDDEEVVWCGPSANNLVLNRLTIANNDDGAAFVAQNHAFGVTVEPAQVLIESCNWEIIETKATGEYTVAVEEKCIPAPDLSGWYLHEKSPHWLMSASSGPIGVGGQISASGRFAGSLHVPECSPLAAFSATDTQIFVTADDFLRMFANNPDGHNTKTIHEVFRPIVINYSVGPVTSENFITTAGRTATLMSNVRVGDTTFYTDKQLLTVAPDDVYKLGVSGNVYPTDYTPGSPPPFSRVSTVTVTASVFDAATGWYVNSMAAININHFAGESLINNRTPLNLNRPIGFVGAVPASCYITLLSNLPAYRYEDDITRTSEATFFTNNVLPVARKDYVVCAAGKFIPKNVIGKMLYITRSTNNTQGERRRIIAVGGPENNYIFVESDFSDQVPVAATFCIESLLQTADSQSSVTVPLGDANSALPASLNSKNINLYEGGHKSIFPGSYIYTLLNQESEPVDQPSSTTAFLRTAPDGTSLTTLEAIYKFPGPRRLIAPPLLPCGKTNFTATNSDVLYDDIRLNPAALGPLLPSGNAADVVGYYVQILGSDITGYQRGDWRQVFKIIAYDPAPPARITIEGAFSSPMRTDVYYRILGDSSSPVLSPGSTELWVDYPELFPDSVQNNFVVTVARGNLNETDINIVACFNTMSAGTPYGKFVISATSPPTPSSYFAGELLELKVTKIALDGIPPVGTMHPDGGGFYCEFGYENTKSTQLENGLSHYLGVVSDPLYWGGSESKATYEAGAGPLLLKGGLYRKEGETLNLPVSTTKTVSFRTSLVANVQNIGLKANFYLLGDNFIDKFYADAYISGTIQVEMNPTVGTAFDLLTFEIDGVIPGGSSGCRIIGKTQVDPAIYTMPQGNGRTVVVKLQMRGDDHESILKDNAYMALKKAVVTATVANRNFVNLVASGGAITHVDCTDIAPVSTALVGRSIKITDETGVSAAAAGEIRTIVSIDNSPSWSRMLVDTNFSGAIAAGTTFEILPEADPLYGKGRGNYASVGGAHTPVSYPQPTMFGVPGYPLSNSGDTKFPAEREYGIIQEYVEYSKRETNILTLAVPHYFKYDHPPGTKISLGTGKTITAGDGSDYRPYIFSAGYLALLFSEAVGFKNLFTAAGIECKTEETELGP